MNVLEGAKVKMIDLDSDKSRCYNHRDKLNSIVQLLNFRLVMAPCHAMLYACLNTVCHI